ncbi:ATP-binding cassette domain-containing protein [Streptococcus anginosus]|uniref:ATP-binding cassette domain-containing protein n=1 Tax=Bacillota TaxID=1239 RepID=UPI001F017B38|nr:ATP-binding cassette domain-containing protein [Anaerococcus ihuae]MED5831242.1 ATP-binding cassette domain-containing protein [Streptococcus anginosus]HES2256264.1 ATP-binding cassette domain-containing protein [Streptococcus pyogenes]
MLIAKSLDFLLKQNFYQFLYYILLSFIAWISGLFSNYIRRIKEETLTQKICTDLRSAAIKKLVSEFSSNSIACVSSDDYIFNMSIRNNIILDKKYDAELLYDVIKRTKIEDFIKDLPRGLETELKSNNLTLSAGQIQRICLARALYSERDLIFIDGGTANLDIKNSEYIEKELFLDSNLTVVMITHRLKII